METQENGDRKKFQKSYLALIVIAVLAILAAVIFLTTKKSDTQLLQHTESGEILNIEIADSAAERAQGLMGKTDLSENFGILFVFENSDFRSFWMKNTPESLDIIFLNEDFEVINFHEGTKPNQTDELYPSVSSAKYALETKTGFAQRVDLDEGDAFILID